MFDNSGYFCIQSRVWMIEAVLLVWLCWSSSFIGAKATVTDPVEGQFAWVAGVSLYVYLFYTCLSMDFLLITLLGNIEYLYRVFIVSNFILCIWKSFLLVAYLSLLSYISIWGLTCQYWCWSHLYLWAPISQDWHTIRCDIGLKLST